MLNWTTGAGTARFHVLRLLLDYSAVGADLPVTTVTPPTTNPFCGYVLNLADMTLTCVGGGTISSIDFAAYGTVGGGCPSYTHGTCDAANATAYVKSECLGKTSCTVTFGNNLGDPCYGTVKHGAVVARCSDPAGGYSPQGSGDGGSVFAQAFAPRAPSAVPRHILLVNTGRAAADVQLPPTLGGAPLAYVDLSTGDAPAARASVGSGGRLTLQPWAVAVVEAPA